MLRNATLPLVFLAACSSPNKGSAISDQAAIESSDDAELHLLGFDDRFSCMLVPQSVGLGELHCVGTAGETSAFPTLADQLTVRATTVSGRVAEWSMPSRVVVDRPFALRDSDLPVKVQATLSGAKYGAEGATLEYTIASLTNDPNQSRHIEVPFAFFRAPLIASGIESVDFHTESTGDIGPWSKNGSSSVTTSISASRVPPSNGSFRVVAVVPAQRKGVTASLQAGATKIENVSLTRPGYYVLAAGEVGPAKQSDLKKANITDAEIDGFARLNAAGRVWCEHITRACAIDACVEKLTRRSPSEQQTLLENNSCTTSCDTATKCLVDGG
jgi:hypothetical protein